MAGLNGWWLIFPCGAYRAIAQVDLLFLEARINLMVVSVFF
jgi:hypothetical protein